MSFRNGKFGRLTIRKQVAPDIFYCDCICGNELHVWRSLLANDVQVDCGICVLRPSRNGLLRRPYNGYGHCGAYTLTTGRGAERGSCALQRSSILGPACLAAATARVMWHTMSTAVAESGYASAGGSALDKASRISSMTWGLDHAAKRSTE